MNRKKNLFFCTIALCVLLIVILAVTTLIIKPLWLNEIEELIKEFTNNDSPIKLSIEKIDRHFFKYIQLSNVQVLFNDEEIGYASKIYVSTGLPSLLKIARGKLKSDIDLKLNTVNLHLTEEFCSYLIPQKNVKETVLSSSQDETSDTDNSLSILDIFQNFSLNFSLNDFSFDIAYNNNYLKSSGKINIDAKIRENFNLLDLNGFIPEISGYLAGLDSDINIQNIALHTNHSHEISLKFEQISASKFGTISDFTSVFTLKDGELNCTGNIQDINGGYEPILVNSNSLEYSLNFQLSNQESSFSTSAHINSLNTKYNDLDFYFDNLGIFANYNPKTSSTDLFLKFDRASSDTLENIHIENCVLTDFFASISLNSSTGGIVDVYTTAGGKSTYEQIGVFSGEINLSASLDDLKKYDNIASYSKASLNITSLKIASFASNNNDIQIDLVNRNAIQASIGIDKNFTGTVLYTPSTKESDIRFYFNDFQTNKILSFFDSDIDVLQKFVDDKTTLNGNFIYSGILDIKDITGRLSINLVANDVLLKNKRTDLASSFEATAEHNDVNVNIFALTALGVRLSYQGSINLEKLYPQGTLIFQKANTGNELARLEFLLDNDSSGYSVLGTVPKFPETLLNAHVKWNSNLNITGTATLATKSGDYEFNIVADRENKKFFISSGSSYINLALEDKKILSEMFLDSYSIHISDKISLEASASIKGIHDSLNETFSYKCSSFDLKISDILRLGFAVDVNQNEINLENLLIRLRNKDNYFDGNANLKYSSLALLFAGVTDDLKVDIDFSQIDSSNFFRMMIDSNRYSLQSSTSFIAPLKISLLGSRGTGFFANCKVADVSFEASYRDKIVNFYNGEGNIGSLNLEKFNFNLNFNKKQLAGSISVKNILHNLDKDIHQGGTIELDAKLDSLVLGALSLAGLDVNAEFNLSLRNLYLGDDFFPKDTDVKISLSKSKFLFEGELINGYYIPSDEYLDMKVNSDFFFGFHVAGFLKNDLDIIVDDIYLPVSIINQFLPGPIVDIKSGIAEGSVLILGQKEDPLMYGSLFVQRLDMGMFYLPEQTLSARDVVCTIHERRISLETIPVYGSSSLDGRYCEATLKIEINLDRLTLQDFSLYLDVFKDPIDFWFPMINSSTSINIRGDVTGFLKFWAQNGENGLDADIAMSNATIMFEADPVPKWFEQMEFACSVSMELTTGKNVEFYYPKKENSFINFTVEEGETVKIAYNSQNKSLSGEGSLGIKSGRIFYINNDFNITEGKFTLIKPLFEKGLDFSLDLIAKLREYGSNGQRVDISLILKNSKLDNIHPRLESIPTYTENEIVNILGQSVILEADQDLSLSYVANVALVATNTMSSLGILNSNKDYSIGKVIRDAFELDVLSFRSPLVQNIIVSAILGVSSEQNLLARYLNGTTLFAGKYLNDYLFAKLTFLLKQSRVRNRMFNYGHFLTDDLNLDIEFSVDWDNPIGNFSVFTQPHELSVSNILDTIGFSFTKRFQF